MTTRAVGGSTPHPALAGFHEPVRAWFAASFGVPTPAQALGWPVIGTGASALIVAPVGSGKTLAAFLAAIDRLMFAPAPQPQARCRVLYVSPLKALAVDVDRNLRTPLGGIAQTAQRLGYAFHAPEVAVRTGDTPPRDRARFLRAPADILITTPESLYLLLTSRGRELLRSVRRVIVDEVHTLVGTKRGAHLALSLERLEALTGQPLQRIGLSATVRPHEEAARFLGGFAPDGAPRPVRIVDAGRVKALNLTVEVAVEDMARAGQIEQIAGGPAGGEGRTGVWPAIHPLILDLIRTHRSTLIFVNSRRLAERLASALNELAGEVIVHAHHGSLARDQRRRVEERLKAGELAALVATSSLELGIDMGAIDLVVQVEAPPSVASGIQRIGRAGHTLDAPSVGVILPKYRGDLLACAALVERMRAGDVEAIQYPRLPLDVLAQQIVAMVATDDWRADDLERVVRQAAPFHDLSRGLLEGTLDMLSGRYPSDEFAALRPRITWDRLTGVLTAREGARRVAIENGGTIPDRGLYGVFLAGAPPGHGRVGELDEEMVFESRVGDTFVLGASTWRIEDILPDRVLVSPAPGEPGRMPFWHGDRPGRPLEFGRAIGVLARTLRALPEPAAIERLTRDHALTEAAARSLMQYLQDQLDAAGVAPDDRTIVVERFKDEVGDWRICLLSPFGGQVHGPWAMAIGAAVRRRYGLEVDVLWTDDGIVVRFPDVDDPPPPGALLPDPDEVEDLVVEHLGAGRAARQAQQAGGTPTSLFAARFREAAARALLLPRRFPGQRVPLWQQRKRAADLFNVAARFPSFPIVLETFRECLRDVFDIPALRQLLRQIATREIRVVTVDSRRPSPFAAALLFNYVANFMYEGDAPLAEARAGALLVDPAQLRDLLGHVELRELLDADALAELERWLQHLAPQRAARHADGLHDLLRDLGDLTVEEIRARAAEDADIAGWLARLNREGRAVRLQIAGEGRYVAVEDLARYRDALGVPLPDGLPGAFLEPVADPLGDLVGRYARTHGPFAPRDVARRFGLGLSPVLETLSALERAGRIVQGEFRPGGTGREWCDAEVLRTLRRRSLARLRREVEPVDGPSLGRFYLDWQGVRVKRRGREGLLAVLASLQGAAIPASVLERDVLPARLEDYDPRLLDALAASGAVVWMGVEPLAPRDGRIRVCLAEAAPLMFQAPRGEAPDGVLHRKIRDALASHGALFFPQLLQAVGGGFVPEVLEALWDLVWAGEVTNDTLQPLRAYVNPGRYRSRRANRSWQIERIRRPGLVGSGLGLPAEASGRWSLTASLIAGAPTPTERLAAQARQLLERYGVLTRDAVVAEGVEGGFAAVYGVLRAMEDAGRIRRGYFVAGLGGTQFALPGAADHLRALRKPPESIEMTLLAATDPANPYGAALPWPQRPQDATARRPARTAGAFVLLADGALAAWLAPREGQLLTFPEAAAHRLPQDVARALAGCLAAEVRAGRWTALVLREVDGVPVEHSPMAAALRNAGFVATSQGHLIRLQPG